MAFKERFINPDQLEDTIKRVQSAATEAGQDVALVGGAAMQFYGSPRMTKNVDFAIESSDLIPPGFKKLKSISFGGASFMTPSGAKADMIVRDDEYRELYEDALAHAKTEEGLRIVTPEHLAAMKLAAGRDHDLLDLKWLLRHNVVDLGQARKIIYRFMGRYAQDQFDNLVDEVLVEREVKRKRGKSQEEE